MKIVTYSLSVTGSPQTTGYHEQLLDSVKSLRRYNRTVGIHAFLYGEYSRQFVSELEQQIVTIHRMGSYADAITRLRPRAFRTLVNYPVLHKWLNFHELEGLDISQVLQADCDTFFFDDVELLFERYSDCHFYAREEPSSRASQYGYDPTYLDEDKLFALARQEGAVALNPYNIGVCVLNHSLWREAAKRTELFIGYVFRFVACIARNPQTRGQLWPELAQVVMHDLIEQPDVAGLPFPSSNLWILDQVALWLTLGHVPGLTHAAISRADVIQGGEESDTKVVHHYFGIDKNAYLAERRKA